MTVLDASVIVALNPHEGGLDRVLDAYRAQAAGALRFELIVVDNGSRHLPEAPSSPAAPDGLRVHWIESDKPGRAAANNAGVRAAHSRTLIFAADDFIPGPSLVRAHVEFQRHLQSAAVGIGPAFFTPDCRADPFRTWLEDTGRLFGVPFRTAGSNWPRDFFYLGNASFSRAVYEEAGGFDEDYAYDLFDDLAFGLRIAARGVSTHLLPKALAWHDHAVTIEERALAMRRSGAAARHFDDAHPGRSTPWSALATRSPADLADRMQRARAHEGSPTRRFDYFSASMDLAFVDGYRDVGGALDR